MTTVKERYDEESRRFVILSVLRNTLNGKVVSGQMGVQLAEEIMTKMLEHSFEA